MLISDEELDRLERAAEDAKTLPPTSAYPWLFAEAIRELRAYRRLLAEKPYLRTRVERLITET